MKILYLTTTTKSGENAVSAFAMYARSFGQLQAQVGVRYEHLNSDYYEFGKRMDEQSRKYDNVFPSISLSYPIGKTQLMISYSGNIERPSYYKLSSAVIYGNKYTYESGNPLLRSSILNTLSLNASWEWLYFNMNYSRIKDMQIQVSQSYSDADPSISLFTHTNVPKVDKPECHLVSIADNRYMVTAVHSHVQPAMVCDGYTGRSQKP